MPVQKSGGSSSNGNGGGDAQKKNADGSVTYQDPLDVYCDDNPETDECRYESNRPDWTYCSSSYLVCAETGQA